MKIKNESIIIKNGKKTYELRNTILDTYLERFVNRQMDTNYNTTDKLTDLNYILLKFDTPLEYDTSSELGNEVFDICIIDKARIKQSIENSNISIDYTWIIGGDAFIREYATHDVGEFLPDYYGRKITAIGFNTFWPESSFGSIYSPVCAIVDVSNHNLYLQENQLFTITRRDNISSDALFWSNDKEKVPGAFHIAPNAGPQIIYQPNIYSDDRMAWSSFYDEAYGIIYSVGLSNSTNRIDKEYIIGQDVQMKKSKNKLIIKNIPNPVSIARTFLARFLPFFSTRSNYKYYIIKYKVWQIVHSGTYHQEVSTTTDTGYFYYMAIPTKRCWC